MGERTEEHPCRFVTAKEDRKGGDLPYYKEYCVEDLPFPRHLICCHIHRAIIGNKKYCIVCGEEIQE